jgi:hypothetical protein
MLRRIQQCSGSELSEAWNAVWSALCHQGSVYSATYAAVPHLVEIAAQRDELDPLRIDSLFFVGAVVMANDSEAIPEELGLAYATALTRATELVASSLARQGLDEATLVDLLVSLAALRGCVRIAELLRGFVDGEFIPSCPAETCGIEVYVTLDGSTMVASIEDPATEEIGERTEISAPMGTSAKGVWTDDGVLPLLVALARRAGHPTLADKIALWDGAVTCPKCREPFPLRATLVAQR